MDLNAATLKKLDSDQVTAHQACEALTTFARESTAIDKSAQRSQVAAFLAAELNATDPGGKDDKGKDKPAVSRYSMAARQQIARVLAIVAGAAEVPALVAAMNELELREDARCALDRVQTDAATDALVAALQQVGPEFRVGVVGSLGDRGGEKVVKALQALAEDEDVQVRVAAANALAKIPDASSDAMMVKLANCPCRMTSAAATKARVRLAETLARSGDKASARRIFEDIHQGEAPDAQKKAAAIGIKTLG